MNNGQKNSMQNVVHRDNNMDVAETDLLHESVNISEQVSAPANVSSSKFIDEQRKKQLGRPLKIFGGICIAMSIVAAPFFSLPAVDTSAAGKQALVNKTSTSLSAGTLLLQQDENLGAKDYIITNKSNQSDTKIKVWDYAAEDGDYVQVLVNGAPLGDAFMIKHKPVEFTVPAVGVTQIKGIKDGGGGITYAVRYDLNGTIYFNSAPEGGANTYTLNKE